MSGFSRGASGALAALAASAAMAQTPPAPAKPDDAPAPADVIVVEGVRPGRLEDPTAFGDVISTDDYEAESQDLADLLEQQVGVSVRRFGGAGDRSEVSIRGSTASQVVVAIDGVRANSMLTGGMDLSHICVPLIDRVEISRGAGAVREGSGAVGGVVNLVTRGAEERPESRASLTGGAWNTWEGSAFRAAREGRFDYSLGYCGLQTDGDFEFARPQFEGPDGVPSPFVPSKATRINNERTQHGATLGAGVQLGPGELRFGDYFVHSDGGEPGLDDGSGEDAGQNPKASSTDWSNLAQLRYVAPGFLPAQESLELGLYQRTEDSQYHDPLALFDAPKDVRAKIATLGSQIASGWHMGLGPVEGRLDVALDGSRDAFSSDQQQDRDRMTGAFRMQSELGVLEDRVLFVPALRGEETEGFGFEWIPAAGVVVSPWSWLRLRANAGRAYRAPSFDELYYPDQGSIRGNPNLDPEEAWNFDAGFELLFDQVGPIEDAHFVASWFRRDIDNSIVWVEVNNGTIAPVNTGEATAQGVELSLRFQLTPYLRVALNHTELDTERNATGKAIPGQPDRESFARVQLGPPDAWKLVGEMLYTGKILVNEGGGRYLPSRTVWNASAAYNVASLTALPLSRWLSRFWIFVQGNNLGDEAVRDTIAFPQPGRNLSAGFEASW